LFLERIEKAQDDIAQRPDCREMTGTKLLFSHKPAEVPDDFVALIENQREGFFSCLVKEFEFHNSASGNCVQNAFRPWTLPKGSKVAKPPQKPSPSGRGFGEGGI
jgi:hypothetical protein